MFSIHEHLKKKRAPIDKWSIKEQLCLASAVVRSGDQNWTSVSRTLKVFQDPKRPADWFSQKNCAAQYGLLLDNVDTPKRKKRLTDKFSNSPEVVPETESSLELIKKKLTEERIQELNAKLQQAKKEYQSIAYDTVLIKSEKASIEKINQVYNAILERKKLEEKKNIEHAVWLREREEKKLEMERQLRPGLKLPTGITSPTGIKFKDDLPDAKEDNLTPEGSKPTTSPLLTSLLKSPSPAPNPSLLHSSLAGRVASLNKSSLVTSFSQETETNSQRMVSQHTALPLLLESKNSTVKQTLPDFKSNIDESSVLAEIVTKVKTSSEATGSSNLSDDILNLDLVPFGTSDQTSKENKEIFDDLSIDEKLAVVDNIIRKEQEEELATQLSQKVHSSIAQSNAGDIDSNSTHSEIGTEMSENDQIESRVEDIIQSISNDDQLMDPEEDDTKQSSVSVDMEIDNMKPDSADDTIVESKSSRENESAPGSVEVVEVELMEDEEEDGKRVSEDKKNLEMSQMVSDLRKECGLDRSMDERDLDVEKEETNELSDPIFSESLKVEEEIETDNQESEGSPTIEEDDKSSTMEDVINTEEETLEIKIESEPKIVLEKLDSSGLPNTMTIEPKIEAADDNKEEECTLSQLDTEDDDSPIEVIKEDKHGKMKRDYSRKRVDDKPKLDDDDFDSLGKKSDIIKYKRLDSDRRSESPWADEEDTIQSRTRRQYSISIDSPNSPASSITEDEKEYRIWKKSIFLVFNRLCTHRNSSLFAKPITNDQAPGYHNLVKRPMDLSTIKKNLDNGTLRTTGEFQRDVMLMFQNAIMYNKIGSTVYNMAKEMQKEGLEQLQFLVQAQSQDFALKRETRTSEPALKRKRGAEK